MISCYRSKFSSPSIDQCSFWEHFDIFIIMSPIGSDYTWSKIHIFSGYWVNYNRILCYYCLISQITSFDFREWARLTICSKTGVSANVRIGSHLAIFSKIYISFNIRSRFQYYSFLKIDISFYGHIWFYNCSFIDIFGISSHKMIIGLQKIPRISDRYPKSGSFNDSIHILLYIDMYKVRNFEFITGRKWKFF